MIATNQKAVSRLHCRLFALQLFNVRTPCNVIDYSKPPYKSITVCLVTDTTLVSVFVLENSEKTLLNVLHRVINEWLTFTRSQGFSFSYRIMTIDFWGNHRTSRAQFRPSSDWPKHVLSFFVYFIVFIIFSIYLFFHHSNTT